MARAAAAEMSHPRSREISIRIASEFDQQAERMECERNDEPQKPAFRIKLSS